MAEEEKTSSIFTIPDETYYIRTPRKTLLGVSVVMLIILIVISALTFGTQICALMLIFVGPLRFIAIYMVYMFSRVWAAYKYSRILLIGVYLLAVVLTPIVLQLLQRK